MLDPDDFFAVFVRAARHRNWRLFFSLWLGILIAIGAAVHFHGEVCVALFAFCTFIGVVWNHYAERR